MSGDVQDVAGPPPCDLAPPWRTLGPAQIAAEKEAYESARQRYTSDTEHQERMAGAYELDSAHCGAYPVECWVAWPSETTASPHACCDVDGHAGAHTCACGDVAERTREDLDFTLCRDQEAGR